MSDTNGFFLVLVLLALVALFKGQFWVFVSLLAGTFIGYILGWNIKDNIIEIVLISFVIYIIGKFIGNKITEHNMHSPHEQ